MTQDKKPNWGTQIQACHVLGLTQPTVSKYCNEGRFGKYARRKPSGQWELDLSNIAEALAKTMDPANMNRMRGKGSKTRAKASLRQKLKVIEQAGLAAHSPDVTGYTEVKTLHERYKTALAKLKFEQLSGLLVPVHDVKKHVFDMARLTRDSILSIPARMSAILAAETDIFKVEQALTNELIRALAELANGKYAGADEPV